MAIYTVFSYFMIGFRSSTVLFWEFFLIEWLTLNTFTYFGILTVYVTPILPLAELLASWFYSLWNLFSGFLIALPRVPRYWVWLYYFNPVAFAIRAIVQSNLAGTDAVVEVRASKTETAQVSVDDYLRDEFGLEKRYLWRDIGVLCLFAGALRVAAMIAIRYLNFQNR